MKTVFHTITHRALLLVMLLAAALTASAYDFIVDGIAYNINDDGTSVSITYLSPEANGNYNGFTDLRLPETVNHDGTFFSVNSVGDSAFHDCASLSKLTIPANITVVNKSAFALCSSLTELILENASATLTFEFPNNRNLVFEGCPLENIYLGRNIYYKNGSPFEKMQTIESIFLGDNITSVPSGLAMRCSGLTSVRLSDNVQSIQSSAFAYCTNLTDINFPQSISNIGMFAFYECGSLEKIDLSDNINVISDYSFAQCSSLKELIIPKNVTSIMSCAFAGCTALSKLVISDDDNALTTVLVNNDKVSPFADCPLDTIYYGRETTGGNFRGSGVKCLTIGSQVKKIPSAEFISCAMLDSVVLPPSVTTLKNSCFSLCTALQEITIPATVTTFEGSSFYGCAGLTNVTIEEGVSYIPTNAFSNCSSLQQVVIPSSVQIIDEAAFYECSNLKVFTINDGDSPIYLRDNNRFNPIGQCSLQEVYMGRNVTYSGNSPFQNMTSLTKVVLGENVDSLGNNVFVGDATLRIFSHASTPPASETPVNVLSVEVPDGCAHIYAADVNWASADTIYSIASNGVRLYPVILRVEGDKIVSVNGMDNGGFDIAENEPVVVEKIKEFIYGLVTKCDNDITASIMNEGSYSFAVTPKHHNNVISTFSHQETSIELSQSGTLASCVGEDNLKNIYCLKLSGDIDGSDVLVIRNMTNLRFLNLKDANVVEGGVSYYNNFITENNKIGSNFIDKNSKIIEIIMPLSVDTICSQAFHQCASLIRVEMPPAVKSIGYMAFEDCKLLQGITIPSTVDYIGERAFRNCSCLSSVNIPAALPSIGKLTFYGCSSLATVVIEDSNEPLPFEYHTENVNWHDVSYSPFQLCPIRSLYMGRTLGEYAFKDNKSIESITIGSNVTTIPYGAFEGCEALPELFIPDNVTEIDREAFANCTSLVSVRFSNSLEKISRDCFSNCYKLRSIEIPDNVTEIGYGAFSHCTELDEVKLGSNLHTLGACAFHSCNSLVSIRFNDNLQEIGSGCFYSCESLSSLKIPEGINTIDTEAFIHCGSLKTLVIEDGNSSLGLGRDVFHFTGIENVYLGRNVQYDSYYSGFLSNNTNVRILTIGENVTQIPSRAFQFCTSLDTIYSLAVNPPEIFIYTFDYQVEQHAILFVPNGSKDEYMNHNLWKKFFRIEEFDTEGIGEVPVGHVAQGKQQRYNIMGQPVGKDYHGVVIENGRKILVK